MSPLSPIFVPATEADQWRALAVALVLLVAASLGYAFATVDGPYAPAFIPAWGTGVVLTSLLTAYLLLDRGVLSRHPAPAALAGGYLYTATMMVPLVLAFPEVFSPRGLLGGGSQISTWIWMLWHTGFPCFCLGYVGLELLWPRELSARATVWANVILASFGPIAGLTCAGLVINFRDELPNFVIAGDYSLWLTSWQGVLMIALNMAALLASAIGLRRHGTIQLAFSLAMLAAVLDVVVTLAGGQRYSAGWYIAKLDSLFMSAIVLGGFLHSLSRLSIQLMDVNRRLGEMAAVDGLTGLANRRRLDEQLIAELRRAQRERAPLSLLLLDVDFFKRYNDLYGHLAGDEVLRRIGRVLATSVHRPTDLAARYGGEEFAVVLGGTGAEGACRIAERINAAVRALDISHAQGTQAHAVTVSIGVATLNPPRGIPLSSQVETTPDTLIETADKALYRAKNGGRDGVVCSPCDGNAAALLKPATA